MWMSRKFCQCETQYNHIIYLISFLCQIHRIKGIRVQTNFKWIKGFAKRKKKERNVNSIVWVCLCTKKFLYNEIVLSCQWNIYNAYKKQGSRVKVDILLHKTGWHVDHFVYANLGHSAHTHSMLVKMTVTTEGWWHYHKKMAQEIIDAIPN